MSAIQRAVSLDVANPYSVQEFRVLGIVFALARHLLHRPEVLLVRRPALILRMGSACSQTRADVIARSGERAQGWFLVPVVEASTLSPSYAYRGFDLW